MERSTEAACVCRRDTQEAPEARGYSEHISVAVFASLPVPAIKLDLWTEINKSRHGSEFRVDFLRAR